MTRYPGLVAKDPETGNIWVCVGGSDALGWQWCWVGPTGGTFYASELAGVKFAHPSVERALRALDGAPDA